MYSHAILAAAVVAAAAGPSLALPVTGPAAPVPVDESGAINFNLIKDVVDIGGKVISGISGIKDLFSHPDQPQQQRREFEELLARAVAADESGAINFNLIKDVVDIGGKVISGISGIKDLFSNNDQQKREFEELLARAVAADESGAINFNLIKDVVDIGGKVISGIGSIKDLFSNQQRRDFEELLARELPVDESGAINFGAIFNIGSSIINGISSFFGGNQKRDLMHDPVAREIHDLLVRQEQESGAINFGSILNIGSTILNGITSIFGGNDKRDAPAAPVTPPAPTTQINLPVDESGAIDFKKILSTGVSIASTVLPFFLKREELEMLARDAAAAPPAPAAPAPSTTKTINLPVDESGAIDFKKILSTGLNIATTVLPFFIKREEMELLARENPDFSQLLHHPLFRIGTVLPTRSLNELD